MSCTNGYNGETFEDYLNDHGIRSDSSIVLKAKISWHFEQFRKYNQLNKVELAKVLGTSRSQLDRLLDPLDESVLISTLRKAVEVIGQKVEIEIYEVEVSNIENQTNNRKDNVEKNNFNYKLD